MKLFVTLLGILAAKAAVFAQVPDPVVDYRQTLSVLDPTTKLMKWEADLNGDGMNEVFITDKPGYDKALAESDSPDWMLYIATPSGFVRCDEVHEGDEVSHGVVLGIDLDAVFVGNVSEMGNVRAMVIEQVKNPRVGDPVATIKAYEIEDGHLKLTKLVEYNPLQDNALSDKYLVEGKRTVVTPVEVNP